MAYGNLLETDRRIIGEFIRQHHARMAHQFACFGIPGPTIIRFPDLSDEFRDIVGVIARSHGVPLRGCIEYLRNARPSP